MTRRPSIYAARPPKFLLSMLYETAVCITRSGWRQHLVKRPGQRRGCSIILLHRRIATHHGQPSRSAHSNSAQTHITASRTASRRLPRLRHRMPPARGSSATLEEAQKCFLSRPPGLPARVRACIPCRLGRRYGRRRADDRVSSLFQAQRLVLAERVNSPTPEQRNAATKGCSCTPTYTTLTHVARTARCASQLLSAGPIPLKVILDLLPRVAGPRAAFLLQAIAAGASLCGLTADASGRRAEGLASCHRCGRVPPDVG